MACNALPIFKFTECEAISPYHYKITNYIESCNNMDTECNTIDDLLSERSDTYDVIILDQRSQEYKEIIIDRI